MRLDHIAFRVFNRNLARQYFCKHFGYKVSNDFQVDFPDKTYANCFVLSPPEKLDKKLPFINNITNLINNKTVSYHMPPEIFLSEGSEGSIVEKWVIQNQTKLHHLAYQVESVKFIMDDFRQKGLTEFTSDEPLECDGLKQVFTKPCQFTGLIYEFIERENGKEGFCVKNVKDLMQSTKDL